MTPFKVGDVSWTRHPKGEGGGAAFDLLRAEFPQYEFFYPKLSTSPWHIQANVKGTIINFWPHRTKGGFQNTKAVYGIKAMRNLILQAETIDRNSNISEEEGLIE